MSSLFTTARILRRARPLSVQRQIAASGEHPLTGNWWPKWEPWTHMTDPVRAILTRFTKGPHGTGARAGRIGGRVRSEAKRAAARQRERKQRTLRTLTADLRRAEAALIAVSSSTRNGPVSRHEPRPGDRGAR